MLVEGNIQKALHSLIYLSFAVFSLRDVLRTLLGSSINYKKWPNACLCGAYIPALGEKINNIHNESVNYLVV